MGYCTCFAGPVGDLCVQDKTEKEPRKKKGNGGKRKHGDLSLESGGSEAFEDDKGVSNSEDDKGGSKDFEDDKGGSKDSVDDKGGSKDFEEDKGGKQLQRSLSFVDTAVPDTSSAAAHLFDLVIVLALHFVCYL